MNPTTGTSSVNVHGSQGIVSSRSLALTVGFTSDVSGGLGSRFCGTVLIFRLAPGSFNADVAVPAG